MPRADPLLASINGGEFSPRMVARTDFDRYSHGAAIVENFLPLPQGGLSRRPGTLFVKEIIDSTKRGRLLPFVFSSSSTQAYILELGNLTFRFYKDRGRIVTADVTGSITNGTFDANVTSWDDRDSGGTAASTWNAAGYMDLAGDGTFYAWREQAVTVTSALAYTLLFRVRGVAGDTVELLLGTATLGTQIAGPITFQVGWHAYTFTSSGTTAMIGFRSKANHSVGVDDVSILDNSPMQLTSVYLEADLPNIHRVQSADVLYLAHASYAPYKLARSGHTSWSFIEIDFQDGPYLNQNASLTTLLISANAAVGDQINITASSIEGINVTTSSTGRGFLSTDVGRVVRILNGTVWGYAKINSITSTLIVTAIIKRLFGAIGAVTTWRLGAWSATTGYPGTLGFFEQRLIFASSSTFPQRLWFSQSADFENHEPDSVPSAGGARQQEADDALDFTLAGNEANPVRWLATSKNLLAGTLGGEWRITSNGPNIQFNDIDAKQQSSFGSANVQAMKMRGRHLFLQRAQRNLYELLFEFQTDNYVAFDQNLLADHITRGGLTELAYQQQPDSILWTIRADGVAPTFTYQPEQKVVGWARQIFGGAYLGGDAVCESVATIPASGTDEVWVIVKRTINGATKRYIEVMETAHEPGDDGALAVYCDAAIEYNSPKTITGATKANPVVITAVAHGFANGNSVRIEDVVGMTEINDINFTVAGVTADTFELSGINGTAYTTYVTGGEVRLRTTSVSGADHLEGLTVKVLADGAVHPERTVTAGVVTLDASYSKVIVGLGYSHEFQSLKWEAGMVSGTAQGQVKRIDAVTLFLMESMGSSVGPDEDHMQLLDYRAVGDDMNAPPPLFTGEKFIEFDGDYETDPRIIVEGDSPTPFMLLGLSPLLKTNPR